MAFQTKRMAVLVAALAVPAVASATNGYFSHGYGMKSKGMAGVGVALPQDALAAATNPAGMVMVGNRVDVGIDWFRPIRTATLTGTFCGPGCTLDGTLDGSGEKNFFIPEFGYNRMLNPNLSLGVSVFGNGGMNTTYNNGVALFANPAFFGVQKAGVNLEQLFIAPTLAYKVTPDHAIGVAINFAYQRFKAEGLQNFTAPGFSVSPNDITNRGNDKSTGWGLRVGWTGQITPAVTLGATYQTKTRMKEFSSYKGLFAEGGDFDIPSNYAVGAAWKVSNTTTLALDVQRINYTDVKSVSNPVGCFFLGQCQLGASNGPGFGWRDLTVVKFGVEQKLGSNWIMRGGYSQNRQPIPASETLFNILAPGVVERHLTLGATWLQPGGNMEVTVGYMHAFRKTVTGSGSIPAAFGGGNANLEMYQNSFGVGVGWKL